MIHGGKTGHIYVHERDTGKLIRFSEAMIPQENMWVLPTKEGARMLPGANGGVEWSPMAVNPTTAHGLCGEPASADDLPRRGSAVPRRQALAGRRIQGDPERGAVGQLVAVNLDTGKVAWSAKTPQPLIGGVLATAGDARVQRRSQRLVQGLRREDRQGAVEVHLRRGRECPGRVAQCCRRQAVHRVAAGGNNEIDAARVQCIARVFAAGAASNDREDRRNSRIARHARRLVARADRVLFCLDDDLDADLPLRPPRSLRLADRRQGDAAVRGEGRGLRAPATASNGI